jgi:DMSO/TMAO reductase YedYZ heme-binding membrane subunit
MKTTLIRAAAGLGAACVVMALLHTSERFQFFVIVTIREIFRIHVTRWYLETLGLLMLVLLVGAIVRAFSAEQRRLPSWRQAWVWRSVGCCAGFAAAWALVDVLRRGLGPKEALLEPLWAAVCVAVLASALLVPQAVLERAIGELLTHRSRLS